VSATELTRPEPARRTRGVKVVGYDGSVAARAALRLAVKRAGGEGAVVVVHACPPQPELADAPYAAVGIGPAAAVEAGAELRTRVRKQGEALLAEIPEEAFAGVPHRCAFVEASPAMAIADVADHEHADEIVIGSRGGGPLRWMLGSVSHALLQRADRPLVVVPIDAVSRASRAGGDAPEVVVAGFDGSPDALGAIRHVGERLAPGSRIIAAYAVKDARHRDAAFLEELEERLAGARTELKAAGVEGVTLESRVVEGPAALALARLAGEVGAAEIAVGSRGLGRFRAALGSVAHALLHESDRPVVVVPAGCV
jgi:nucleotide-binding universal stress UspA family protein